MKLVLLSGGSGKRLWPLSNEARSKQFLKVLRDAQGKPESMLQRLWKQITVGGLQADVYISTNQDQVELIQSQIDQPIPLIIEPARRDTFPAISLAAAYLKSVTGMDENEVIAVMPVDPYIEDEFMLKVRELEQALIQSGADIGLLGVTPTYPSTQYGYILAQEREPRTQPHSLQVITFAEKPTQERATELLAEKALWNCGVFAFKLGYMLQQLERRGLPVNYLELAANYEQMPKISFDYEIVEKAAEVIVIPYAGVWRDLGTWDTLTENMPSNVMGQGIISDNSSNTHVLNQLEIPIVIVGVSDVVIAASPDGILVADKQASHRIKEVLQEVADSPRFVERRWGWVQTLDRKQSADGKEERTNRVFVFAGKTINCHIHQHRREIWVVLAGDGELTQEGVQKRLKAGEVIEIPAGTEISLQALTDIELIEIQLGRKLAEDIHDK